MMGQALLVPFKWFGIPTIVKRDSPGWAKPETSPELGNQLGSILLATLNADRANSFAMPFADEIAPACPVRCKNRETDLNPSYRYEINIISMRQVAIEAPYRYEGVELR
ncbi:hypothetical protein [Pseudomonas sp. zfem005]|uniref:hypothetical protein n=1 Tax=Pseudomonas sp. zfem005 TaxID=3078200 RepID=UPI002927F578|nr:hypothetical protein [Pseudomonas sp. zfem005]MDU9414170.1 hypothetical protein [Pseudomonas sp. zfem005]